jgi:hypothetical protein
MQRVMFLPKSIQIVDSIAYAQGIHASRTRQLNRKADDGAGLSVPLQSSPYLVAYMGWPNDETKRNQWLAAVKAAGLLQDANSGASDDLDELRFLAEPALDAKARELEALQAAWTAVADLFQRLVDMATEDGLFLRNGASIGKAIDLCQLDKRYSRAQLERFWSHYRDVAHLVAAAAFLAAREDARPGSIFSAAWTSPDAVIGIADGLEFFGLANKSHGSIDTFLPFETTWRLPEHCCKQKPFLVRRRLSDAQRKFLESRKSRKQYLSKPT